MKVLFAVNDEKDAESITRMYQKEFKEIITSKTVYYYNAIIKELQKDKSYDRIVISEDLEMFSSNNYQAVDKFVFEKMDAISDEATNNEGGDIPIILLAMDRRTKNDPLLVKLFGLGIYNVLLGKDRSVQKVAELINKPRSKKEAKAYYRVETEKVSYSSDEDNNGVSESEMQSILNHYKRIGGNIPKCVRSFDSIISQYSEEQAKLIAKSLPKSVTEILEDNSDSYRKLLGIEGQRFPGIGAKKDNDYVEKEIETSSKLKQPVIIPTAVSSKKINRVRSAEEIRRAKLRLEKEKAQEEAQKREEERIEREKAEMARKKREQLLKERAEAEAKRKAEVEAKRKEREKILRERAKAEARRKEEERIAREKAEEEARRKEEERIAREKAEEEERRKEEERIAREKAEEEARRKEEERIAREKAKAEARRKEEERIAKEKAREEARRKEEERIAREKAEAEAKKKEERKIKAKTVATKSTKEENNDDEIVTTKRRRGRPRKNPVIEEIDENNELEDVPVKRRRGRPRKNPIIVENEKEDEVVSNRKNTTTKESDNKQNKHNDDIDKDNDLDEFDNLNYNDDEINDDKYYNDKYDDESDNYDDDFDYDDYDFDDLDDDYKSEDLEEDYNDDKDSKLSEFDDYDDKDLDDTSDYEDEDKEDDDTLPGFDDYDDEDSEDTLDYEDEDSKDSKDTLDYEDEDEEDDDTLPGFEDYDDEDSEDSKDTLDYEDEDEEDDDTLPGFDDYDDEDSDDSKDTLDYEDEDEEDDDTLPGFDDYDDEDSEDSKDTLDYEDEDEEDDDPLPGFDEDEDEDDNDFKDTENDYKEENDDDIDDMFDYDDEEDNKEEEKEENQTQHNGTFKGINNRNYRYDNNLADSIKDLKETEETQEYNVDTDNLITSNQKIISFVGTSKNGTSFIVNNLAELFSNRGINTAILDLTKNKNSYYVYTNNENELKEKAQTCLDKLKQGIADGVQVNKNLTVYTSLPNEDDSLDEVTAIIHTLLENYSIVLLDCDFDTDVRYFKVAQEIYLVQSLDVLTIQPLTAFLRDLKVKNILDTSKLRIIINKNIKMKLLDERNLIAGMSSYNDPAMTYMTELFDENTIKFITIPFEDQVYVKYLESLVNCNINLKGYSKNFMSSLNKLADMVYPTINGKKAKENYNNFSKNTNSILDKMKKKY